jgi:hypothetical protein
MLGEVDDYTEKLLQQLREAAEDLESWDASSRKDSKDGEDEGDEAGPPDLVEQISRPRGYLSALARVKACIQECQAHGITQGQICEIIDEDLVAEGNDLDD